MLDHTEIRTHAQQTADALMAEVDGARAVIVATVDGFDVARAGQLSIDAGRLAAMISSMSALGDAAGRESAIGRPRGLVVDASEGRLVVRSVTLRGQPLVLVLVTESTALLGQALNALNAAERELVGV